LSPGFVNAHAHLYGGLAHGMPLTKAPSGFWPFLEEFWWPKVENRLDQEMICTATDNMLIEMIKSETTTIYDCVEAPFTLPNILEAQAEVVEVRWIRAILSFEATERVNKPNGQLGLEKNAHIIQSKRKTGGLISGLICFHTTFTCTASFIRQAFEMAKELAVLVHMHCSEGTFEPKQALKNFGLHPIEFYQRLGFIGSRKLASQCVQITQQEIAIMSTNGVWVTHTPLSNGEVSGGIAPVPDPVKAGVTIGLGSDGYINDIYEVMRGVFLIHKAFHQNPRVMPASLVWYLATEGSARAPGLDKVGHLAPGWQADMQLIDSRFSTPVEEHNLYDQLLLYRNHNKICLVMVAGKVLARNGVVSGVDEGEIRDRTNRAVKRLWRNL
jgi:5-methylthioadenosine/S-adenosylhomocysteine deaminase